MQALIKFVANTISTFNGLWRILHLLVNIPNVPSCSGELVVKNYFLQSKHLTLYGVIICFDRPNASSVIKTNEILEDYIDLKGDGSEIPNELNANDHNNVKFIRI